MNMKAFAALFLVGSLWPASAYAFCIQGGSGSYEREVKGAIEYLMCLHNEQVDSLNRHAEEINSLRRKVSELELQMIEKESEVDDLRREVESRN